MIAERFLGSIVPALLIAALLGGAVQLSRVLRDRAQPVAYAGTTVVTADATPAVLGHQELGQNPGPKSASKRHLFVDRPDGQWVIANASDDRRVFARDADGEGFYLQRWPLETGDEIVLAGAAIEVVEASKRLRLRDADSGRSVTFEDGELIPEGETVHPVCHSTVSRLARSGRWALRDWADGEIRLFSIGGGVNCESRWRVEALEPESVHIAWSDGTFTVAPGVSHGDVLFVRGSAPPVGFTARTLPIDGIERLILGRTVYALSATDDALSLEPVANRDLFRDERPDVALTEADWAGAGLGADEWIRGQLAFALVGCVGALALSVGVRLRMAGRRRPGRTREAGSAPTATASAFALAALGGWLTVLTQRGEVADALLRLWLAIGALGFASVVLALRGRLAGIAGIVWFAGCALALFGTLVLLTLGAGADNSQWMRFYDKHVLLVALFGWSIGALGSLPTAWIARGWLALFNAELLVAGAGALLVVAMAAQLTLGSEAGIAGIQPVELTKSVYVILLAFAGMHLVELRRRDTREFRRSPLMALLPFLRIIGGFALVVLSIVVGVRDFSPGIILGLVTLLWLFRIGRREREGAGGLSIWSTLRPAVAVALAAVFAAGAWARANPEKLPADMPQRDRILVWSQPALHPHSGSQVLAAMDRVGEGGWTGAHDWFGPNEEVMKVPAVQDDFITAFLLNRFGGYAGLGLLGLQLFYLVALLHLARRVERATARGDFREQNAGRVAGIALYGFACMHGVHWSIAWCNTLGLLPVMGQPMTWLSAGNSHLLGFALPTLLTALVSSWVLREFDGAR